jgi:hypothetical protein
MYNKFSNKKRIWVPRGLEPRMSVIKKSIMGTTGPKTKNVSTGEDQQQIDRPTRTRDCALQVRRWDSIVGIATSYRMDDRGIEVRVPVRSKIFSTSSRPALGSTQPIQRILGALSPWG